MRTIAKHLPVTLSKSKINSTDFDAILISGEIKEVRGIFGMMEAVDLVQTGKAEAMRLHAISYDVKKGDKAIFDDGGEFGVISSIEIEGTDIVIKGMPKNGEENTAYYPMMNGNTVVAKILGKIPTMATLFIKDGDKVRVSFEQKKKHFMDKPKGSSKMLVHCPKCSTSH